MANTRHELRPTVLRIDGIAKPVPFTYDYFAGTGGHEVLLWPGTYWENHAAAYEDLVSLLVGLGHSVVAPHFSLAQHALVHPKALQIEGVLAAAFLKQRREDSGDPTWQAFVTGHSRGALTALSAVDHMLSSPAPGDVPLIAGGVLLAPWSGMPRLPSPLYGLDVLTSLVPPRGVTKDLPRHFATSFGNALLHTADYMQMSPDLMFTDHSPMIRRVGDSGTPFHVIVGDRDRLVGLKKVAALCELLHTQPQYVRKANHWCGLHLSEEAQALVSAAFQDLSRRATYQPHATHALTPSPLPRVEEAQGIAEAAPAPAQRRPGQGRPADLGRTAHS